MRPAQPKPDTQRHNNNDHNNNHNNHHHHQKPANGHSHAPWPARHMLGPI